MNSSYFNIRGNFTVDWDGYSDNIFITRKYSKNTEETITFEHKDELFTMCHKVITNNVLYNDIDKADYDYNMLLLDKAFSSVAGTESNLQTMKQIKDLRNMI